MSLRDDPRPYSVALICFEPDYGHLQPLLKIADALAEANFHVKCYLANECAPLMSRFQFEFALFDNANLSEHKRVVVKLFTRGLFINRLCSYLHYLLYYANVFDVAARAAPTLRRHLTDQRPDVIICDRQRVGEWCSRIAAFFNVPLIINNPDGSLVYNQRVIVQIWGITAMPEALQRSIELAAAAFEKLCRVYCRIRYMPTWLKVRTAKHACARAFETAFPVESQGLLPVHRILVGTAALERERIGLIRKDGAYWREFYPIRFRSSVQISPGLREWIRSAGDRPIVFVSFGSAVQIDRKFGTAIYEGLRRLPALIVWSLPENQRGLLASLSMAENIRIESFVSQAEILDLPAVRCFITQGGQSSIQESLVGGTPMLCIPFFADQGYNSSIVEHLQVGRRLWRYQVSSEAIRTAVEEILTNSKYLKISLKIKDELQRKEGGKALTRYVADIIQSSRMDKTLMT